MQKLYALAAVAVTTIVAAIVAASVLAVDARGHTRAHRASASHALWPPLFSAGRFLLTHIDEEDEGRWGSAWSSLYPFHKRIVAREAYARCEAETPFAALPLGSVQVVRVRRARVVVPGLAHTVAGVAVTLRAEFQSYGPRDPVVISHTFHLVPVVGRWTWLLSPSRYLLYVNRGCGAAAE